MQVSAPVYVQRHEEREDQIRNVQSTDCEAAVAGGGAEYDRTGSAIIGLETAIA
jgi:hypothetical protein